MEDTDALVPEARRRTSIIMPTLAAIVALTLLFTAQDALRTTTAGGQVNWRRTFEINALDWVPWIVLVPVIARIGGRYRLDQPGRRLMHGAVWAALGLASCAFLAIVTGIVVRRTGLISVPGSATFPPLSRFLPRWFVSTFGLNILSFGMFAGVYHAALYYRDLERRRRRQADLEARLATAELNVLRMQLQPHLFFNTLHTISSLMMTDVDTAHRVISALGDLLRASLDHTARQEVTLRDELAFVSRYLEIQKARFRQRLTTNVSAADDTLDALVPSFVLQPLVENAIRHGIESHADGGTISIAVARVDGRLTLSVIDDASVRAQAPANRLGALPTSGVGLANLEARLAQLYGSAHAFRAGRTSQGEFEVVVSLPWHTDPSLFPSTVAR